jgi:hypothetical protein
MEPDLLAVAGKAANRHGAPARPPVERLLPGGVGKVVLRDRLQVTGQGVKTAGGRPE